jgi:hypothetical protein
MNPLMHVPHKKPGKFRVGQRVRILYGRPGTIAEVVEDRGPLGIGGRRLYGVRFRVDPWNEITTERPEDALEAVEDEPTAPPDGKEVRK